LRSRGAIAIVAYILPAVVCVVWILALGADASTGPAPRPAMRAVFLDIDGVMLPFGSGCDDESGRPGRFPDRCLKALDRVLIETGAEIVLSSTWRCAGGATAVLDEFAAFAERERGRGREGQSALGAVADEGQFRHITDPEMHLHRQWEIANWIESAQSRGVLLEGWVALDDEELVSSHHEEGGGDWNERYKELFAGRHVKTISHIGLTESQADIAIRALRAGAPGAAPAQQNEAKNQYGRTGKRQRNRS
jgi:hypothetical protein